MCRSTALLRGGWILIAVSVWISALIRTAVAACGDEAQVQCRAEFESIAAIVRAGDGFTLAGQFKDGPTRGVAILRVNRAGVARGTSFPVPLPANFSSDRSISEPRKLIALSNGDVILLAQIGIAEGGSESQVAWAARITPNDRILWSRTFSEAGLSTIIHSGYYEPNEDKLILVGRRTNGPDPALRCEKWSQSWVVALAATSGQSLAASLITFGEQTRSSTNRQAIYDITSTELAGSYLVTGFLTARHSEFEGLCQDNIFTATLTQSGNRWTLSQVQAIGYNNANEVAFAIKPAGEGRYLLAGHGRDQTTGAPAAQAYRVRITPFAIEHFLSTPYPLDGSDKTGGDRYRIIVPLAERGWFLLAGSVSVSRDAPNRGMWQIVSAELKANSPPNVLSAGGSDIQDAVLTPEGRVLAVGRWVDEGHNVGWIGFIGDSVSGPSTAPSARRAPDTRLPRLSNLQNSNGMLELPGAAMTTGVAYFERDLQANSQLDLSASVANSATVAISVYPESGDVDLLVLDANKRPVAFSNFRKSATELLPATLAPGKYQISLIAQTQVPAFEFRIAPVAPGNTKALSKLDRLSDQQRIQFAETLIAAGYNPPSNPSIALGGESLRAFLAIQEGAQREIDPSEIARVAGP